LTERAQLLALCQRSTLPLGLLLAADVAERHHRAHRGAVLEERRQHALHRDALAVSLPEDILRGPVGLPSANRQLERTTWRARVRVVPIGMVEPGVGILSQQVSERMVKHA